MQPQPRKPKPKQLQVIDPEFEGNVSDFIDAILEEEKKSFQPGVESFQLHANRVRQEVSDVMHEFHQNYANGYQMICDGLEARGIPVPVVDPRRLEIFDDPVEFMDALDSGSSIYQLLGFTPEQMTQFYEVATKLTEEANFSKAKDAFYFLVIIAPDIAAFWLGLGMCQAQVRNYEASRDAFRRSIELNPQNPDAYLGCIHAHIKTDTAEDAVKLCDEGIATANANLDKSWAEPLQATLEEAKQYVTANYLNIH